MGVFPIGEGPNTLLVGGRHCQGTMHAHGEVTKMAEATSTTMTFSMGGEAIESPRRFFVKYNLAVHMHQDLELWLHTLAHHGSAKLSYATQNNAS